MDSGEPTARLALEDVAVMRQPVEQGGDCGGSVSPGKHLVEWIAQRSCNLSADMHGALPV